jgi:hypothetical protein
LSVKGRNLHGHSTFSIPCSIFIPSTRKRDAHHHATAGSRRHEGIYSCVHYTAGGKAFVQKFPKSLLWHDFRVRAESRKNDYFQHCPASNRRQPPPGFPRRERTSSQKAAKITKPEKTTELTQKTKGRGAFQPLDKRHFK